MSFLVDWIDNSKLFNRPESAAGLSQIQTVYTAFAVCWLVFLFLDWTGIDLPQKNLKRKDTVDWHSRVISSIHAVILCVGQYTLHEYIRHKRKHAVSLSFFSGCTENMDVCTALSSVGIVSLAQQ